MTRAEVAADQLHAVMRELVRRMCTDVSQPPNWSQRSVLKRLETDGPMTTADLARAERLRPQTMGELVAELEDLELVARKDDADDGRRRVVSITRAGTKALAEGRAARHGWLLRAIETQLDANEQRALLGALDLLEKIARAKD